MKVTSKVVAFSALRSSKNCAILSAKKERCVMGVDCATTMKICWVYRPREYDAYNLPARAKLKEIVGDSDVLDFITNLSLSGKMAVADKRINYFDNRIVWTLEVIMTSRGDNHELLEHKENLGSEVDTLVDIREWDNDDWHHRRVEANGKVIFEEEWVEDGEMCADMPSEDFNKTTEDFIIDEFMPDVRVKLDLSQSLPQ